MQPIVDAISTSPKEGVALLAAILAATVALAVAIFTQLVLSRRETTKLLTEKLEELYLCAVKWEEEIDSIQGELEWFARNAKIREAELKALIERQTQQRSAKLIGMYVELYFRPLRRFAIESWQANRGFEVLLTKLKKSEAVSLIEIRTAAVGVQKVLAQLRSEITRNREYLTKARLVPPRYEEVRL